jgi:hypothetical protein
MPLPPSMERSEIHQRGIELRGYRRVDGLYDIEARMVDTKASDLTLEAGRVVPQGEPIHDMSIRIVVDEDLTVIDIVASTDASPFGICREATRALEAMKGRRIATGWSAAVREQFAGRKGCTHLTELLGPLATVAFQTLSQVRNAKPPAVDASGRPHKVDSCYAYASDREIVQRRWPMHYDGPKRGGTSSKGDGAGSG